MKKPEQLPLFPEADHTEEASAMVSPRHIATLALASLLQEIDREKQRLQESVGPGWQVTHRIDANGRIGITISLKRP